MLERAFRNLTNPSALAGQSELMKALNLVGSQ